MMPHAYALVLNTKILVTYCTFHMEFIGEFFQSGDDQLKKTSME